MSTRHVACSWALAALLLLVSMGAAAGELEQSFERQLARAKGGNVAAMYAVGELYELGMGTEPSRQQALNWYRAAADNGHPEGAYQLGYAYYWGKGLEKDRSQAHAWFLRAAERGSHAAMPYLSKMYALGQGVPQDKEKAREWTERAATDSNLLTPPPEVSAPPPPPVAEAPAVAAPEPEPAPAPRQQPSRASAPPRAKATPKPAGKPRDSAGRPHIEQLLASYWLKGTRPALYLPSSKTRCQDEGDQVTCRSETRRSSLLGRAYGFRIVATLTDFDAKGGFTLSYRPEVTGVLQGGPAGYGAGEEPSEAITEEQLRARVERDPQQLSCQLRDAKLVSCHDAAGHVQEFSGVEPERKVAPDAVVFSTPLPDSGRTDGAARPLPPLLPVALAEFRRSRIADRRP